MKRWLWTISLGALAIAACSPSLDQMAPPVTPAMAASSKVTEGNLQLGRAAYIAHCGRCHEYQLPDTVSDEDWHVVVPGMAWNAGLSKQDEVAIRQYLIAAKTKQ
jgi:mono/diheme cytochrome c family protein